MFRSIVEKSRDPAPASWKFWNVRFAFIRMTQQKDHHGHYPGSTDQACIRDSLTEPNGYKPENFN